MDLDQEKAGRINGGFGINGGGGGGIGGAQVVLVVKEMVSVVVEVQDMLILVESLY